MVNETTPALSSQDEKHAEKLLASGDIEMVVQEEDFIGTSQYTAQEKSILKKLQIRIFPWMFVMYFLCYIDRANISNAVVMNQEKGHALTQTTLTSQQVSVGLGLFYVGYVLFEIPSNLMLVRVPASWWFARIMISWGIVVGLFALVSAPWHFFILRFLLGVFEAGFFPGVAYYMTLWFRKRETSSGFSYWFLGLPFSNAISSLLSTGISYMDGVGGLYGWRWNFILFAIPTILVGAATVFYLPDSPKRKSYKNNFLTKEELEYAGIRLDQEASGTGDETAKHHSFKDLFLALKEWKAVAFGLVYLPGLCSSTSLAYYVPTLVKSFGIFTSVEAQLLAAPVWFYAAFHMLLMAHISDRIGNRSYVLLANATLAGVSFIMIGVLANVNAWASYAFIFLALGGTKTMTTVAIPWASNTFDGERGAAMIALVTTIGNAGNIVTSFTLYSAWSADVSRKYLGSNVISGSLMSISVVSIFLLRWALTKANKVIDEKGSDSHGRTKHYIL